MPPGAAFCPVFGGAFTVRFVTFSVVMGDGAFFPSSTDRKILALLQEDARLTQA